MLNGDESLKQRRAVDAKEHECVISLNAIALGAALHFELFWRNSHGSYFSLFIQDDAIQGIRIFEFDEVAMANRVTFLHPLKKVEFFDRAERHISLTRGLDPWNERGLGLSGKKALIHSPSSDDRCE